MMDIQAVAFGEIVFDCFEDSSCIGGAPLNFAWYLRQFGISVAIVSAVGRDKLGNTALRLLHEADIDPSWVSRRSEPTGTVDIQLLDGQPRYTINEGTAWEYIELPSDLGKIQPTLLYFGTAAQKTQVNRSTLRRLWTLKPRHSFFDVNLRQDHYSGEIVLDGLRAATILKLNHKEWRVIQQLTSLEAPDQILETFGLEIIALTRGSQGAVLYVPGKGYEAESTQVDVVDTVGAGDAFSAALASGVILGADLKYTLQVACKVGTYVVQRRGAQIQLAKELHGAFKHKSPPLDRRKHQSPPRRPKVPRE